MPKRIALFGLPTPGGSTCWSSGSGRCGSHLQGSEPHIQWSEPHQIKLSGPRLTPTIRSLPPAEILDYSLLKTSIARSQIFYDLTQLLLLLLLLLKQSQQCKVGREWVYTTLPIRIPQTHTTDPWKEEKEKIVEDITKEQIRPTGKHWLCS